MPTCAGWHFKFFFKVRPLAGIWGCSSFHTSLFCEHNVSGKPAHLHQALTGLCGLPVGPLPVTLMPQGWDISPYVVTASSDFKASINVGGIISQMRSDVSKHGFSLRGSTADLPTLLHVARPPPPSDSLSGQILYLPLYKVQMGMYCKSRRLNSFVTKETSVEIVLPAVRREAEPYVTILPSMEVERNGWRRQAMFPGCSCSVWGP